MGKGAKRRKVLWISMPIALLWSLFMLYLGVTTVQDVYSLKSGGQVIEARIVERGPDGVKYRFRPSGNGPEFYRRQLGSEIWSDPGESGEGTTIAVRYVPANPFVNQPAHEDVISADRVFGVLVALAMALVPILCIFLPFVPRYRPRRNAFENVLIGYSVVVFVGAVGGIAAGMLGPSFRRIFEGATPAELGYKIGIVVGVLAAVLGLFGGLSRKRG